MQTNMFTNGIINICKPEGITSHDVIYSVRRRLHLKKVGHTGTLDPMATGVLPICFGKATRIIEYYETDFKTYIAEMQLGTRTDTLDRTGTILTKTSFQYIDEVDIINAFSGFIGEIEQTPPKYSALKVNGKKLYQYARAGIDVEIKKRKIYIDDISINNIDLKKGLVSFEVTCSKGTYVRTICDDIGNVLGVGACMTSLVRTKSGYFDIADSITLDELEKMSDEELESKLTKMDDTLQYLGKGILDAGYDNKFCSGQRINQRNVNIIAKAYENYRYNVPERLSRAFMIYSSDRKFLGVAFYEEENYCYKADKVINIEE